MPDEYRIEKLIRDRIPEIIRRDGREPLVRQVDDAAVRPFVALKVIEEAFEVYEAFSSGDRTQTAEEVADLMELVERLLGLAGLSWEEVRAAQRIKAEKRGAFFDNYLLAEPPGQRRRLHSDFEYPLLPSLKECLEECVSADMAVSFVMRSGVEALRGPMAAALGRGAKIRLLTSDYLDITEPEALAELLHLRGNFQMRAYREPSRSFHPKAYIFEFEDGQGTAFIGSSNMSASALVEGIEWNYEVRSLDSGWPLGELVPKFDALFNSPYSIPIDQAFIEEYRTRRRPRAPVDEAYLSNRPRPRGAQIEALVQLDAIREQGERKAMVIAATGIGKTYLAAFDSLRYGRVLFLAHRDELLTQAQRTFASVRPEASCGFYKAGTYDTGAELLFASVSTLSRPDHFQRFAPDAFDYIVVDEFHHAAAQSYLTLLHYFEPRFLLGLTATPYRADNRDVFAICDGNVAYRVTFMEAIAFGWLCPFRYYGLYDEIDYTAIPWRNGRYEVESLSRSLENARRAEAVLQAYREHPSHAAVGFCVSIEHARFMAAFFTANGVAAQAVHSGADSPDRAEAIGALEQGGLAVLFTVDLFNEGVDIPAIDLVMFLRPTESVTIFLQQLGRGLRLHPGKEHLTVLDFIGNYKKAHYKLPLIAGRLEDEPDPAAIRKLYEEFESGALLASLPPGVEFHFEDKAKEVIRRFVEEREPRRKRLVEAYRDVRDTLGHRPTLLELHRWGREDVRHYRQEFRTWYGFLRTEGNLREEEASLEAEAGEFLVEIEKTRMSRSFKMVVLQAFIAHGGLERPVAVDALAADFRGYFVASERHRGDLGPEVAEIAEVSSETLRAYLVRNPIVHWTNAGKSGKQRVYFAYDASTGLFSYIGPQGADAALFRQAVIERVEYRLAEYFELRYERKNVFRVISAGENRGIIMLGRDEDSLIPRGAGWTPVMIDGVRMYARFAEIAINMLKDEPREGRDVPNRMTEVLERWFGAGGYLPERGNYVRITRMPGDEILWEIEPVRRGS